MIDGVNDRDSDAVELAALCRRLRPAAHVNLIPLNPTPGLADRRARRCSGCTSSATGSRRSGVNATVRRNRGTDIDAACGQLAAGHRTESSVPVRIGRADAQQPARRT